MIDFNINIDWKNKELFDRAPEIFKEEKTSALTEVGLLLEREVVQRTPVGVTSNLKSSIESKIVGDRVEIGTPLEYAEPVEYGTKPHWPPKEPLELWGLRKLGSKEAGRSVWVSISKKGTKPVLMFTRALAMNYSKIIKILESIGDRIASRFK